MATAVVNQRDNQDDNLQCGDLITFNGHPYLVARMQNGLHLVSLGDSTIHPLERLKDWVEGDPYRVTRASPALTKLNRGESVTLTQE